MTTPSTRQLPPDEIAPSGTGMVFTRRLDFMIYRSTPVP